jgi:hypothetical protein
MDVSYNKWTFQIFNGQRKICEFFEIGIENSLLDKLAKEAVTI